jgi:hypothetical protein
LLIDVPSHLSQFDEKLVRAQRLGYDQAAVEWGLNPPTGEHDSFKHVLNAVDGRVGVLHCGGF